MNKLLICADHPMFGGAYKLMEAINAHCEDFEATLMYRLDAPYGAAKDKDGVLHYSTVNMDECNHFFVCDYNGLIPIVQNLSKKVGKRILHTRYEFDLVKFMQTKHVAFFWTGTYFMNNCTKLMPWVKEMYPRQRYAMPELIRCDTDALPLYQPFDIKRYGKNPFTPFTVTHSAGGKYCINGEYRKGSDVIERVFEKLKKKYPEIVTHSLKGVPYEEALKIKRESTLFVDQFMPHVGGMGKSSLEALCYGVPVLSTMNEAEPHMKKGQYKGCPTVNITSEKDLYKVIEELYQEPEILFHLQEESIKWAKVLSYKTTVDYLERTWKLL